MGRREKIVVQKLIRFTRVNININISFETDIDI
jgi:hypothetical protein